MATTATIRCITSTSERQWANRKVDAPGRKANLALTEESFQTIKGWGGCFNELGALALEALPKGRQKQVMKDLFHPQDRCRFSFCRLPIGASDYGAEWYSLNENDGDFAMKKFSIARDKEILIPYIKKAVQFRRDLQLFASPWSPPTWMKVPRACNYGTFIMEKEYLDAYALYFRKFIEAYAREGLDICQIHPQNEPVADQKFPSCVWTGEQMATFIGRHLGPELAKSKRNVDIWLGTLNTDDFNGWTRTVMNDSKAAPFIKGIGLQWDGKGQIQRCHEAYPELDLMQTENECGDGRNTWGYAEYVFNLIRHYLGNGANYYVYWNMILPPGGRSTWGWNQNAMVTIDTKSKNVTYNPEFYVMEHFSHFVDVGAVRVGLEGEWCGNALAFENPDGSNVVVVHNPFGQKQTLALNGILKATLEPQSINTFVF